MSPYLRANDLKVSVHDGKATLTGKVEESVNKDLAKQIALGVNGIKDVDNQIVIQADYTPPAQSSERSFGEVVDDATITSAGEVEAGVEQEHGRACPRTSLRNAARYR